MRMRWFCHKTFAEYPTLGGSSSRRSGSAPDCPQHHSRFCSDLEPFTDQKWINRGPVYQPDSRSDQRWTPFVGFRGVLVGVPFNVKRVEHQDTWTNQYGSYRSAYHGSSQGFKLAAFHHKPGSVTRAAVSALSAPAGNQRDDNSIS